MSATKIDGFHWTMITDAIRAGTCVPFLGAAVNVKSRAQGYEYKGLPLGPEVALRLLKELLDDGLQGVGVEELQHYAGAARAGWRLLGKILGSEVPGVDAQALKARIAEQEEYAHLLAYEKVEQAGLDEDLKRVAIVNLPRVALHFGLKAKWDYPFIKQQLESILLEEGAAPSKLLATLAGLPLKWFDLRLMSSVNDVNSIPTEGKNLIIVANVQDIFHFRAFAADGKRVVDTDESQLPDKAPQITELKSLLSDLWGVPELPQSDKERVISAVTSIVGYTPLKMIVTTNYDRLMEEALEAAGISFQVVVQPIEGFNTAIGRKRVTELANFDGLILYKFHGEFGGKSPGAPAGGGPPSPRIILTEEDYIEFLSVLGKDRAIPNLVRERLADNTLLFLGYSLEDWDFRTMHKILIDRLVKHSQRTSFAIQKDPPEFWVSYWESKKVVIYNLDLYEFADQLKERLAKGH